MVYLFDVSLLLLFVVVGGVAVDDVAVDVVVVVGGVAVDDVAVNVVVGVGGVAVDDVADDVVVGVAAGVGVVAVLVAAAMVVVRQYSQFDNCSVL